MKKNIYSIIMIALIFGGCGDIDTANTATKTQNENLTKELLDDLLTSKENVVKNNRSIENYNSDKQEIINVLNRIKMVTDKNGQVSSIAEDTITNGKEIAHIKKNNNDIYLAYYWLGEPKNSRLKGVFILKKYKSKKSGKLYKDIVLVFEVKYKNGSYNGKIFTWAEYIKKLPSYYGVLNKPHLITPVYNKEVSQYNTKFEWKSVSDATEYRFLLSTKKDFSNFSDSYNSGNNKCISSGCYTYPNKNKDEKGPLTLNSFIVEKLKNSGQTYYWKVRAYNANTKAASPWSTTGVFKTKGSSVGGNFVAPNFKTKGYSTPTNPYYYNHGGQCTAYAFGRAYEKTGKTIKIYAKNGKSSYPNAKYWYLHKPIGLKTGRTIKANSVAVWDGGNAYGHVAFVEKVENGYVYFTEANVEKHKATNWGGGYDGYLKTLSLYKFEHRGYGVKNILGYIYLQ